MKNSVNQLVNAHVPTERMDVTRKEFVRAHEAAHTLTTLLLGVDIVDIKVKSSGGSVERTPEGVNALTADEEVAILMSGFAWSIRNKPYAAPFLFHDLLPNAEPGHDFILAKQAIAESDAVQNAPIHISDKEVNTIACHMLYNIAFIFQSDTFSAAVRSIQDWLRANLDALHMQHKLDSIWAVMYSLLQIICLVGMSITDSMASAFLVGESMPDSKYHSTDPRKSSLELSAHLHSLFSEDALFVQMRQRIQAVRIQPIIDNLSFASGLHNQWLRAYELAGGVKFDL